MRRDVSTPVVSEANPEAIKAAEGPAFAFLRK